MNSKEPNQAFVTSLNPKTTYKKLMGQRTELDKDLQFHLFPDPLFPASVTELYDVLAEDKQTP